MTEQASRRDVLRLLSLAGAAVAFEMHAATASTPFTIVVNDMKLRFYPYTLDFLHMFTIATSSRTTTPTMMVEVEKDGVTGYGEASMPPYLGESQASADAFLKLIDMSKFPIRSSSMVCCTRSTPSRRGTRRRRQRSTSRCTTGWKKFGQPWHRIWARRVEDAGDVVHDRHRHGRRGARRRRGGEHLQGPQGEARP